VIASAVMRVAMVGSGGVGGYLGGRLAAAGSDVSFIARGAHLEALRARGLLIHSPLGDLHLAQVRATADPTEIGPVDVVFFTVKLYDTDSALALLPPLLGPETVVVPFQNGVETVDRLTAAIGREHTAGGTAYVTAVVAEPGVIRHTANNRFTFGELDGTRSRRLEQLREACQEGGIEATLTSQIDIELWTKFVWLTVLSGVTAATRCPVGTIRDDADLVALCQAGMLEGMAVARARGIALPLSVLDDLVPSLQRLPPHAKSSMLDDLERGRRLELPWLSGAMVRIGEELGVLTPTHRFITTILTPHVRGQNPTLSR
jgi:2-dehydropantoate 2-reductase